ncbi:MAG: hypothetical protein ABJF23_31475 [Bryobacteraceae bacterium]
MAELIPTGTSKWWRFERYEIVDGNIRPCLDAKFEEYDPWSKHEISRGKQGHRNAPYQGLIEICSKVAVENFLILDEELLGPEFRLTETDEKKILGWCSENGLLGVLTQRLEMINFQQRWESFDLTRNRRKITRERYKILSPTFTWYTRVGDKWTEQRRGDMNRMEPFLADQEKQVLDPTATGHVLLRDHVRRWRNPKWQWEELPGSLAAFFPSVSDDERSTYRYPLPLSEAFWREYQEPVREFLLAARVLNDACVFLQRSIKDRKVDSANPDFLTGAGAFRHLLAPVSTGIGVGSNSEFTEEMSAPSLLSMCSKMAQLDILNSSKYMSKCDSCQLVFTSLSPRAKFCSAKCRTRTQKRIDRAKQKSKLGEATGE